MGKKFKRIKETKKSVFYENDDYTVKLTEGGYVYKKNDMFKPWYDWEKEEGEYFYAPMSEMTVKSKKTGKKSKKRVYQGNPIQDLEDDLKNKRRFSDIFEKIDKK
ncbi:MAG: hypothetical protein K1W19_04440 [Lachnospiraceae bacterium]